MALAGATFLSALVAGRFFVTKSDHRLHLPYSLELIGFISLVGLSYVLMMLTNAWFTDGTHQGIRIQTIERLYDVEKYVQAGIYAGSEEMKEDIDRQLAGYAVGFKIIYVLYFSGILLAVNRWFWRPIVFSDHWDRPIQTIFICWFILKVPLALSGITKSVLFIIHAFYKVPTCSP
ncbi:MAG: hypothetical protein AAF412_00235 [Pseudomonadota bacterium]